ncbi:MAG TPA: hypothetical protein VGU01_14695 [Sphingomicrobium sp.]|nr:hypothetical protein [Sphingomicrobium sp.]
MFAAVFAYAIALQAAPVTAQPSDELKGERADLGVFTEQNNEAWAQLKSGDAAVCANRDIIEAIPVLADGPVYDRFIENGGKLPSLNPITAVGLDRDIGEVRCDAFAPGGHLKFTVRPSLSEPGTIVIELAHTAESDAFARWMAEHTPSLPGSRHVSAKRQH